MRHDGGNMINTSRYFGLILHISGLLVLCWWYAQSVWPRSYLLLVWVSWFLLQSSSTLLHTQIHAINIKNPKQKLREQNMLKCYYYLVTSNKLVAITPEFIVPKKRFHSDCSMWLIDWYYIFLSQQRIIYSNKYINPTVYIM